MPLYEYTCQKCEHSFEALVFDGEQVQCPQCQTDRVERQFGVPSVRTSSPSALPMNCSPEGPPCGAPWCRKK
jgi:putative FmdB family regulatory protein